MSDQTELEILKEAADNAGISYNANIGLETLRKKLNKAVGAGPVASQVVETLKVKEAPKETIPQRNTRLRREANRLVRINLTCMNPSKQGWPGELITFRNSAVGTISKMIPFDTGDGYHIPVVLLNVLRERQYKTRVTKKINGKEIKQNKLVREFAIEELPPLTNEELKELATQQAVNRSMED